MPTVIISGTGFRTAEAAVRENVFLSRSVKVNIGAATARVLAEAGFDIIMVARTTEKLERLCSDLRALCPGRAICGVPFDILVETEANNFASQLQEEEEYFYVHSAGLGTAAYAVKDDNPYLPLQEVPLDLPTMEFDTVVRSLMIMTRALLPRLRRTPTPRIVIVNSMSGIRSYPLGYSHASAKAGLHGAVRSLTLELSEIGVLCSEILPGIVDTGLYDGVPVQEAVHRIAAFFGRRYETIPQMSPYAVAETIKLCLQTTGHIVSINMVAAGQWPHQGA